MYIFLVIARFAMYSIFEERKMETRFILLNMKTFGLKCLNKPIEIQFHNKTMDKDVMNKPIIKSIYGTNGEGKTALAHTLNLYKNSCTNSNYLSGESYIGTFKEIVNKKSQKVLVDIYFSSVDKSEGPTNFHHIVEYTLNDKELTISHEQLLVCNKDYWGNPDTEEKVYETINGEFSFINKRMDPYKNDIVATTRNTLSRVSAALPILSYVLTTKKGEYDDNALSVYYACLQVISFAYSINVFIDNNDKHQVTYAKAQSYSKAISSKIEDMEKSTHFVFDNEIDEVDISQIDRYKKEAKNVCAFLKIFKPDLKDIRIEETPNRDKIMCKKVLIYKDGSEVSSEYESSGVKKLIKLYPFLNSVDSGGISFIDEFDSNIHDVYLCKLVEYFASYTSGQLIFTTHNLGPMELLSDYKMKHSIDFINKGQVTSWKRNGNYSVVNLYRSGAIQNCPFNIDATDFIKVFGE